MWDNWMPAPGPWPTCSGKVLQPQERPSTSQVSQLSNLALQSITCESPQPQSLGPGRKRSASREQDRTSLRKRLPAGSGILAPPLPDPWRVRSSLEVPQGTDLSHAPVSSPGLITLNLALLQMLQWFVLVRLVNQQDCVHLKAGSWPLCNLLPLPPQHLPQSAAYPQAPCKPALTVHLRELNPLSSASSSNEAWQKNASRVSTTTTRQ